MQRLRYGDTEVFAPATLATLPDLRDLFSPAVWAHVLDEADREKLSVLSLLF